MSRIDRIRNAIDTMDEKAAIDAIRAIVAEPGMTSKARDMPIPLTDLGEFTDPQGRKATVYTTPKAWKEPGPPPTQPNRTDKQPPATAAMIAAEKSHFQDLTDKILKDFRS
jgi:hypothetical protein